MVVEDDALIAMALQIMLEDEGYVVVGPVSSVQAAMAKVEAQKLDAAILDVNLGREMVFPVADALAAAHIPFVLVTGHSLAMLPAHHRQRPVLNKPFQQRELLDVLRRVIVA
jgi:DNA-binding response OmpR family regulator